MNFVKIFCKGKNCLKYIGLKYISLSELHYKEFQVIKLKAIESKLMIYQ